MSSRLFFSLKCCLPAWRAITLPLPVTLKRLAAACACTCAQGGAAPKHVVPSGPRPCSGPRLQGQARPRPAAAAVCRPNLPPCSLPATLLPPMLLLPCCCCRCSCPACCLPFCRTRDHAHPPWPHSNSVHTLRVLSLPLPAWTSTVVMRAGCEREWRSGAGPNGSSRDATRARESSSSRTSQATASACWPRLLLLAPRCRVGHPLGSAPHHHSPVAAVPRRPRASDASCTGELGA